MNGYGTCPMTRLDIHHEVSDHHRSLGPHLQKGRRQKYLIGLGLELHAVVARDYHVEIGWRQARETQERTLDDLPTIARDDADQEAQSAQGSDRVFGSLIRLGAIGGIQLESLEHLFRPVALISRRQRSQVLEREHARRRTEFSLEPREIYGRARQGPVEIEEDGGEPVWPGLFHGTSLRPEARRGLVSWSDYPTCCGIPLGRTSLEGNLMKRLWIVAGFMSVSLLTSGLAGVSSAAQTGVAAADPTVMTAAWHGEAAEPAPQARLLAPEGAVERSQPRLSDAVSGPSGGPDAAVQGLSPRVMPAATSWDGMHSTDVLPPDPSGEVGPSNYVQMVNSALGGSIYSIYDKSGNALTPTPLRLGAMWPVGNDCNLEASGDGLVLYDQTVDRWVLTQLTNPGGAPYSFCMAISKGSDPLTSGWWIYTFETPGGRFPDYLKFGVWGDGYYMTANETVDEIGNGVGLWAFDRTAMLSGAAPTTVYFHLPTPNYGLEPADIDGPTAPPAGEAEHFAAYDQHVADTLLMWDMHVDWATPANSTLTAATSLAVAHFTPDVCSNLFKCVPQPGTTAKLDSITDQIMYRLAYRNFGSTASLVVTHAVNVNNNRTGIRWYELAKPLAGVWAVKQQGTFSPDRTFRWVPSAATDKAGDIAIGYAASSSSVFPGIRYAGRLASNHPDVLGQGEGTMKAGRGSQTTKSGRWGDYFHMSVDPTDDCTFWLTGEYMPATRAVGWVTRFGKFSFPSCNLPATSWTSGLSGGYSTSGEFALFHQGTTGTYTGTLSPVHPGSSATIWIDKYMAGSGTWKSLSTTRVTLSAGSDLTFTLRTGAKALARYRMAAHYAGNGGDRGSNADWSYFQVTS